MGYTLTLNGGSRDEDAGKVAELADRLIESLGQLEGNEPTGTLSLYTSAGTHSIAVDKANPAVRALTDATAPTPGEAPPAEAPPPATETPPAATGTPDATGEPTPANTAAQAPPAAS